MIRIRVYDTQKTKGAEGWVNPNHVVLVSDVHDDGFAKVRLNENFVCYVDKEGHEKLLKSLNPEKTVSDLQDSFFKMVTLSLLGSISVWTIAVLIAWCISKGEL